MFKEKKIGKTMMRKIFLNFNIYVNSDYDSDVKQDEFDVEPMPM